MPNYELIIFILILLLSLLSSLVLGIIILATKILRSKEKGTYGIILLVIGLLNLIIFNLLIFKRFNYSLGEIISLILLFLIPFVEGLVFLVTKEITIIVKKVFGILLIILPVFWMIMIVLSSIGM